MIALEPCPCPLCGSDEHRLLLVAPDNLWNLEGCFKVVRCRRCRHAYMYPRPTESSLAACYPTGYGPHAEMTGSATATSGEPPPASLLVRLTRQIPGLRRFYYWLTEHHAEIIPPPPAPGAVAIEVGCARGRFLKRLQAAGWTVRGVELVEEPAHAALADGLQVHCGTLESAAFADQSADALFAWMVVEHVPDPVATLREVRRILKPGGRFYFSVPNFGCWERHLFRSCWHALELPRHLQHFDRRGLARLADAAGLQLVQVIHQNNFLNVVGSLGILLRRWRVTRSLGGRLVRFTDEPTQWWQLAMSPLAKLCAALHQAGRITCVFESPRDG
jgi:2-polyprenyl-3-methyl-5-hydroxy-6-metoxy-1,4-benzoquinol methylase